MKKLLIPALLARGVAVRAMTRDPGRSVPGAETVVALAIILTLFRHRRRIDLDDGSEP